VKNDVADAAGLADLLRMGRLPEAWIAPPAVRELRELVRHRAKLVGLRTSLKCQVHAVLASAGIAVPMSDLFGVAGSELLEQVALPAAMRAKVESCRRVIDLLDFEIGHATKLAAARLHGDPAYAAVQSIPGVGPVLGLVFVAEIGDVRRFTAPGQLAS
jgi:transposase